MPQDRWSQTAPHMTPSAKPADQWVDPVVDRWQEESVSREHMRPSQQTQPQPQQPAGTGVGVSYSPPSIDMMGATQDWWDLAGVGGQTPQFSAPRVSAPSVAAPSIPQTPDVTPGYYSDMLPDEEPTSELEGLIDSILGREPEPAPEPVVDHDYINTVISQYGLEPRSEEEIRDSARAIAERQAFQKEQVVQREIDRFEREFPNEFRKAQSDIMQAADQMTGEMQEETAARGMFYSSIMSGAASAIDEQTMQHINDIASDAASRVAGLRDERRDVEEWKILEQEVIQHQLEEQDHQRSQQLAHMHVEIATWADQQALDTWYREEQNRLQHDQLSLQAIQMKQQEAERLGQNYASAMMADHPLVQGTLQDMGISPQEYEAMPMEQQAALVNQTVGFNEIEQQMRQREFQMRATVAEIQLQNANMQLQASIASGQMQMDAMRMNLQAMQHQDQMQLAWAGHGLDVAGMEHQIGMDQARLGLDQQRLGLQAQQMQAGAGMQPGAGEQLNWDAYNTAMGMIQQEQPEFAINRFLQGTDPATQQAVMQDWQHIAQPEPDPDPRRDTGTAWDSIWDVLTPGQVPRVGTGTRDPADIDPLSGRW